MGPTLLDQIKASKKCVVLSIPKNNNAFVVGKVKKNKNTLDK